MPDDTINALILKGSTLTREEIERLREICKPYSLTGVVEDFLKSVLSGEIKVTIKIKEKRP